MKTPYALSEREFKSYFREPMQDVTESGRASLDIWPYVEALDLDDIGIPSVADVRYVYRDAQNRYDQVLIGTGRFNALLVIVVDRQQLEIVGHHLLNLNDEYGVSGGHLRSL